VSSHNLTTIAISRENYFQLKEIGKMHESFNDVVARLLAEHGGKN